MDGNIYLTNIVYGISDTQNIGQGKQIYCTRFSSSPIFISNKSNVFVYHIEFVKSKVVLDIHSLRK